LTANRRFEDHPGLRTIRFLSNLNPPTKERSSLTSPPRRK
jgi:hypothetical protein